MSTVKGIAFMDITKTSSAVANVQEKRTRDKDIVVDSFLMTTEYSPSTHMAIKAAGASVKQVRDILTVIACPVS